jgi:hypothetical protein
MGQSSESSILHFFTVLSRLFAPALTRPCHRNARRNGAEVFPTLTCCGNKKGITPAAARKRGQTQMIVNKKYCQEKSAQAANITR